MFRKCWSVTYRRFGLGLKRKGPDKIKEYEVDVMFKNKTTITVKSLTGIQYRKHEASPKMIGKYPMDSRYKMTYV